MCFPTICQRKERYFKHSIHYMTFGLCPAGRETLPTWDRQIQGVCVQVNSIVEKITTAQPDWMLKTMEAQLLNA